jgi:hypothetical protein
VADPRARRATSTSSDRAGHNQTCKATSTPIVLEKTAITR